MNVEHVFLSFKPLQPHCPNEEFCLTEDVRSEKYAIHVVAVEEYTVACVVSRGRGGGGGGGGGGGHLHRFQLFRNETSDMPHPPIKLSHTFYESSA